MTGWLGDRLAGWMDGWPAAGGGQGGMRFPAKSFPMTFWRESLAELFLSTITTKQKSTANAQLSHQEEASNHGHGDLLYQDGPRPTKDLLSSPTQLFRDITTSLHIPLGSLSSLPLTLINQSINSLH